MSGNMGAVAVDSLKSGQQLITFESSECSALTHDSVVLLPSDSSHATGSSHIKMKTIVDYAWEHKYYDGHIAAVHGEYLAYAIKGKSGGVVRVVSRSTDDRALIKGMSGAVKDLAFAHTRNETLLAVVDELGDLSVFRVDEDLNKKLVVAPYLGLRLVHETPPAPGTCHRVVWCPYIPDDDCDDAETEETAKLLLVTHGNKAHLLNVAIMVEEHGPGPLLVGDVSEGFMEILDHGQPVADAAFSPDGTALATASVDGYVKFYQIYMQDKDSPRMLHEWQPHDGQPLSSLFFLDNHRDQDPNEPFWKYAVTGACQNTELKVWTCESWNCLQTIRLQGPPAGDSSLPATTSLQAALDSSAQYLLLSDIHRRLLYVLSLSPPEVAVKYFTLVREFRLMTPGLSLAVVDARRRRIKPFENVDQLDSLGGRADSVSPSPAGVSSETDEDALPEGVVIRCYMVQPRSLQECVIVYQSSPGAGKEGAEGVEAVSSQNGESLECLSDHLSDLNTTVASAGDSGAGTAPEPAPLEPRLSPPFPGQTDATPPPTQPAQPAQPAQQPISLMTPEEFTSPTRTVEVVSPPPGLPEIARQLSGAMEMPGSLSTADSQLGTAKRTSPPLDPKLESAKKEANSCGSSPSIEVQEILNKSSGPPSEQKTTPLKSLFPSPPPPPPGPVPTSSPSLPAASSVSGVLSSPGVLPSAGVLSSPGVLPSAGVLSSPGVLPSAGPVPIGGGQNGWPSVPAVQPPGSVPVPAAAPAGDAAAAAAGAAAGAVGAVASPPAGASAAVGIGGGDSAQTDPTPAVLSTMSSVLSSVRDLSGEVQQLRAQLQLLQARQKPPPPPADLSRILETALNAHQRHIEELLLSRDREERQRLERQLASLSGTLSSSVRQKMDAAVKQEFKEHVLPLVTSRLKPLEGQIRHEMSARIGDVEAAVKESISKTVNVKAVSESVAHALTQSLQQAMVARYREVFSSTALPAFERSTRELLHQINGTFSTGTKEYLQQLEQQAERLRRHREPSLQHLQAALDAVRLSVEHLGNTVKDDRQRHDKHRQEEAAFLSEIREEVRRAVSSALEEQSARGVTPGTPAGAPTPTVQQQQQHLRQQIVQLVNLKQWNAAFQMALSASDLELVVMVCEMLDPQQLFSEGAPCPLQQPVLLALVQQLSADLSKKTDIKRRYLEEAVLQIDKECAATKEHLPHVLAALQSQLQGFIAQAGAQQAPLARNMRMLLMAVRSLAS